MKAPTLSMNQLGIFGQSQTLQCTDPIAILREWEKEISAIPRKRFVSYGAGRNSTALLIGLWSIGIRPDAILFADTGGEKPETYALLEIFNKWLVDHDFPEITQVSRQSMELIKHGRYATLEGQCIANKTMPSKAYGGSSCSISWKVEPMQKWIGTNWGNEIKPICYKGIHAGEIKRFFGKSGSPHLEDSATVNLFPLIYPLRWHQGHCEAVILAAGLPLPPKSACFFCPNNRRSEVVELKEQHPELYERAIAIESAGMERTDPNSSVRGLGRRWSWKDIDSKLPLLDAPFSPDCHCVDD